MDILNLVNLALIEGATEVTKPTVPADVKEAYSALRSAVMRQFNANSDVSIALRRLEDKPESEARREVLKEELGLVSSQLEGEIAQLAESLEAALRKYHESESATNVWKISGDAIAKGSGGIAIGQGGVTVGSDGTADIYSGTQISGDYVVGDRILGDKISRQINTNGGAYVSGSLKVGGDFAGRDQYNYQTKRSYSAELSATGQMVAILLNDYFTEEELRDICLQFDLRWENIVDTKTSKAEKAAALVGALEQRDQLQQLKLLMRVARPQLRGQL